MAKKNPPPPAVAEPADPPTVTAMLAAVRRFVAHAFPDCPATAVVVVPAPGVPELVLPMAGHEVPAGVGPPPLVYVR